MTKSPISPPDHIYCITSARDTLSELSRATTVVELLDLAHGMWCGPYCEYTSDCTFLHYPRSAASAANPRSVRSRYNKDTAELFFLMGGGGYVPDTSNAHEVNLWPLMRATAVKVDDCGGSDVDYSNWSKKDDTTASLSITCACRDSVQWMANWCGALYASQPLGLHYIAFSTICDDICIPPLDLVNGHFRMHGRSLRDLVVVMDERGWDRDGVHALLSLVRQYIVQYAEKVDFAASPERIGVHDQLNQSAGVWDAVIYRTHTANTYGAAIVVGRVCGSGPSSFTWLMDSSICDAISMDLCKSAMDVYRHDDHPPTASKHHMASRKARYHSLYLDLIDDLVNSGAPDALVHFGRAGFLFVQLQDRYHERRIGRRIPIRPTMAACLRRLFGSTPTDCALDRKFHSRLLHSQVSA